jgi:hypothetical protein
VGLKNTEWHPLLLHTPAGKDTSPDGANHGGGLRITDLCNRTGYAEARAITDSNVTKYVLPSLLCTMQHKHNLPSQAQRIWNGCRAPPDRFTIADECSEVRIQAVNQQIQR